MHSDSLQDRLVPIRLLAMDVDGVLTAGDVTWIIGTNAAVAEAKSFNVKDGLGLGIVHHAGIRTAWITGRRSDVVEYRGRELGIGHICQGARDKRAVLASLTNRLGLTQNEVIYIGDDLNDLPAFSVAGVRVAVADAATEVRDAADWITAARGGCGAVREVCERLLHAQGRWDDGVQKFLRKLEAEQSDVNYPGAVQ